MQSITESILEASYSNEAYEYIFFLADEYLKIIIETLLIM